ncbi:MAG TPA: acyl-CoA desaturase [Fimbriimonadaceae bacterium]|nr:acyl-CoA desaturase [Fimbriimonadaceae bacterium]
MAAVGKLGPCPAMLPVSWTETSANTEIALAVILTSSPEKKKPLLHQLITDIIIFAPVLAIPAAIVDIVMRPPSGWQNITIFALTAFLFTLVGCKLRTLGISLGFHRQGTHPSYQTHRWLRGLFFMLGATTAQGKMVNWLSDHHHHHIHSDEDEDLHSPRHGFWHAYIGWLRGLLFDRHIYPQFAKDKQIMFYSNTFFVWLGLGLIVPTLIGWATGFGAYRGLLYGGGLGIFFANYVTYWVNAGCHKFGQRDFETKDLSTNFWLKGFWGHKLSWCFAYLSWGETNHNNHHARSISANHGMFKGQFDPSANLLRFLEKVGLVWNVQWTTEEEARALQEDLKLTPEERKKRALEKHAAKQKATVA